MKEEAGIFLFVSYVPSFLGGGESIGLGEMNKQIIDHLYLLAPFLQPSSNLIILQEFFSERQE